jgi:iron complex transport system ATP-binding protein
MTVANDTRNPPAVHLAGVGVLRGERVILEGIDWRVEAGEFAAVLGPNGAGKSTLTRLLMGYLWATWGQVTVLGNVYGRSNLNDVRTAVRLVQPAGPFDFDPELPLRSVVATGFDGTLGLYDAVDAGRWAAADAMIDRVGLGHVRGNRYQTLSSGERVRTQVARALVAEPKLLILDEPTAGLDIRGREELLAVVDSLQHHPRRPAVIVVTHHTEELPRATSNVLLLAEGRNAGAGRPESVLRGDVLSRVYDCPVDVRRIDGRYYLHATSRDWTTAK